MKLPKKIAVLMGGPGSERDVSLATGRGVAKALRSLGMEVGEVDVRDENVELPGDVDLAFLTIHGKIRPGPGANNRDFRERSASHSRDHSEGRILRF